MKPLKETISPTIEKSCRALLSQKKIALFIVAYNAEEHIQSTLKRIPRWCLPLFSEIYIIDDSSKDNTRLVALETAKSLHLKNFTLMTTPKNQGYGGNQKIGYAYAIQKKHDIVILLHGDGQYPPEHLPKIIFGYTDPSVDLVFGSRMIHKASALFDGMPIYKWIGNQILTYAENFILGTHLSEFHSGYRSYRTNTLKEIPFHLNSDDFHFDTDILIQINLLKKNILEIPMPTHYGNEKCHVNGIIYARNCLKSVIKFRLHQAGIFFQPNLESLQNNTRNYNLKSAKTSLHAFILQLPWKKTESIIDLGANDGLLSQKISNHGSDVTAVDIHIPKYIPNIKTIQMDLNQDIQKTFEKKSFDTVIALDIIEHLYFPETSLKQIHAILKPDGMLYASTANIGYIIVRLALLFGWFNYGKKGILDQTHHRLFTTQSFRRTLENAGFSVIKIEGFGPPIIDEIGNNKFWRIIDHICWFLAKIRPSLFAFNFLIIAKKNPSLEEKIRLTEDSKIILD